MDGRNSILSEINAAIHVVDRFTGEHGRNEDAHEWTSTIEDLAEISGWNEETCLKLARLRLAGEARTWLVGLAKTRVYDWETFKTAFLRRFGEKQDALLLRLTNCKQHDN
jgi:hypothetical protein